jgi:methionine synthase II (cobalamin-independent)
MARREFMRLIGGAGRTELDRHRSNEHGGATEYGSYPDHAYRQLAAAPQAARHTEAKYSGQHYDEAELNSILAQAVADCVRKQVECGVEIVTDGEYSKPGFFTYIRERFDEFE